MTLAQHRDEQQRDHDQEEDVVAAGLALGHGDPDVAQHGRHDHQADEQHEAPERAPRQAQDPEAADGIRGDPLRGEREAEEEADQRDAERERDPMPPAVAGTEPERGEDRVCRDDPEAHVRVVHADPLWRRASVDEDDDPEQDRHRAAAEEQPRETYRNRAISTPAITPGTRQAYACRPISTEATPPPALNAQELLAIGGWVLLVLVEDHDRGDDGSSASA
jgi:hypothetical protein